MAAVLRAVGRVFVLPDGVHKEFRGTGISRYWFYTSLIMTGWESALRFSDLFSLDRDQIRSDGGQPYCLFEQHKTENFVRFRLQPETVDAIDECVASGNEHHAGRSRIWPIGKGTVRSDFTTIVNDAIAVDGIRRGPFKWLRRASVTVREVMHGMGTLAAGHTDRATIRFYVDRRQLQAAPLPPPISPKRLMYKETPHDRPQTVLDSGNGNGHRRAIAGHPGETSGNAGSSDARPGRRDE